MQQLNQFVQAPLKGGMDLKLGAGTIPCAVKSDEATPLIPGQCVKMVDSAGGVPVVTAAAADTDDVFGVVVYSSKDQSFAAGKAVEIAAFRGCVVFMEASAAIARNAQVEPVITGSKVATAASGKRILGRAIDKAVNAGDLIRVYVDLPGALVP